MNQVELAQKLLTETLRQLTPLDASAITALIDTIPLECHKKGAHLLRQGEPIQFSYYLVRGCIRQFLLDDQGKETTVEFYTDGSAISTFSYADAVGQSLYSLSCLEDSVLVACPDLKVVDVQSFEPEFREMIGFFFRKQFTDIQRHLAGFKQMTPEERFLALMQDRPELLFRAPQHLLANYLDITPESFSRYKKRFAQNRST